MSPLALFGILLLGALFGWVGLPALVASLVAADLTRFLLATGALALSGFAFDVVAAWILVRGLGERGKLSVLLPLVGFAQGAATLNHAAGQGVLGLCLARASARPLSQWLAMIGWGILLDLVLLVACASSASLFLARGPSSGFSLAWLLAGSGSLFWLLFLLAKRRAGDLTVARVVADLRPGWYFFYAGNRIIEVAAAIWCSALALGAFGLSVPPLYLLLAVPAVRLVAALPLSPQGVGTTHAAVVFLYKDFAASPGRDGAALALSYGVATTLLLTLFRLAVAAACLPFGLPALAGRTRRDDIAEGRVGHLGSHLLGYGSRVQKMLRW